MMKNSFMAVLMLCLAAAAAAAIINPQTTLAPAPAPTAAYVNLTYLLSVAGPFRTFLNYLDATKVIDTFQNQANNTDEGITIFVPTDQAFSSNDEHRPSLSNLTRDHLRSLILFHALPHYYSLSDFTNLSRRNPVPTFAGAGLYALNFTDSSGTVLIDSGWTKAKVTSAVHAADPVAVYQIDRVLLPEAIFGTDIPPTVAPVPVIAPSGADHRRGGAGGGGDSPSSSSSFSPTSAPSSAPRISNSGVLIVPAVVGGGLLLFSLF